MKSSNMILNNFLSSSQLGFRKGNNGHIDLQFLLPRFECKTNDIYTIQGRNDNTPPFCVQFCTVKGQEHIYALACEDGELMFMNSNLPAKKSQLKSWTAHRNAVFDITWRSYENHLLTASGDQTIALWDTTTLDKISCFQGHGSSVKSISLKPDNENVFVTGSRDGNILVWDSRTRADPHHESVISIYNAHDGAPPSSRQKKRSRRGRAPYGANNSNSITCVLFQDEYTFLSTGASDWSIKGWDIRLLKPKSCPLFHVKNSVENYKNQGYTSLVMHPNRRSFFTNCTDSAISQYEVSRTMPSLISSYRGHNVGTYFVKMAVSCDAQFIISGSSDDKAYIWQVSKPGYPLGILEGHDAEVTSVAWYPNDMTKLLTCGDDERVFHWSITSPYAEKDVENPVVGTARLADPEEIRLSVQRHHNTPLSYTTPSTSTTQSPLRSTTVSSAQRLTHWFTPKTKASDACHKCEFTPKVGTLTDISTPVKTRSVFCELGNNENRNVTGISAIRRTINFGSKSEPRPTGHNPPKRVKLSAQPSNYSIKQFFKVSPRPVV